MSLKNIKEFKRSESGFTIVELLIVIVVIAILAAITIVSYNGITARANSSSAQQAANSVIKKAEAYNAEIGTYPTLPSQLTSATADKPYALTGVNIVTGTGGTSPNFTTALSTAPPSTGANAGPAVINWYSCTNPSGAGLRISYWKYDASTPVWTNIEAGGACTTWTFKSSGATS